jgi:apolipoprotein N-acyltransferase
MPLRLGPHGIGVSVCYENLFPAYVAESARSAELLVTLSNDVWLEGTPAAEWHFALARLRAVEQRRFLVLASNSGISAIVTPTGRTSLLLPRAAAETGRGLITWLTLKTLYSKVGDTPWQIMGVLVAASSFFTRSKRKSATPVKGS